MKKNNMDHNRIMDEKLREEMKVLILHEFDDKAFRRGDLFERYQKTLEAKNLPVPAWRKFNNMFYTVSKNLRYAGLLKSLGRGTYYANAAEIRDEEPEEEFVGTVEDGDIIEDEEPEMSLTKIVGTGQSEVYVYYYPAYRELAKKNGEEFYRCKIGRTSKGIESRMGRPFCTDAPERRTVAVRIRTDFPEEVEKYLHAAMKSAGRKCANVYGREWFMTNPEEVMKLYTGMADLLNGEQETCLAEPMYTTV